VRIPEGGADLKSGDTGQGRGENTRGGAVWKREAEG